MFKHNLFTQNNICDVGSPRAFVCELFSITRIDQEFLLAI